MKFFLTPRQLGIAVALVLACVVALLLKVDELQRKVQGQEAEIARAKERYDGMDREARSSVAACYEEFRRYKRAQKIQEDRQWCDSEVMTHKDVSMEGCLDRRAKEWGDP